MPAKLEVDWAVIREEWENSDISDVKLAERWGFKSPTPLGRRRKEEGWTRDLEAIRARVLSDAAAGTSLDVRGVREPPSLTEDQQTRASEADEGLGERGDGPGLPPEALGYGVPHARSVLPSRLTQAAIEAQQRDEQGLREDLHEMRVRATRDQIVTADRLILLGDAWLDLLVKLAGGDPFDQALALSRLQAMNPDKETVAGLMKSLPGLIAEGIKLKRQALAMDQAAAKGAPAAEEQASGPVQQGPPPILRHLDLRTLEALRMAAVKLQNEPQVTVEGKVVEVAA